MVAYASAAAGDWHTATNWTPNGVPTTGDTVSISHNMAIDADVTCGDGTIGLTWATVGSAGFKLNGNADLTIGSGATLTVDGDIGGVSNNVITMDAGTSLVFSNAGASKLILEGKGVLVANGTSGNMCSISSTGTQWSNYQVNASASFGGDGRLDLAWTTLTNAKLSYNPHGQLTTSPYRWVDCVFDGCYEINLASSNSGNDTATTGRVELTRCRTINTVPGNFGLQWGILVIQHRPGVEFVVDGCMFDEHVWMVEPRGSIIQDSVFQKRIGRDVSNSLTFGGEATFSRNLFLFQGVDGQGLRFGDTLVDNIIWSNDAAESNPHFHQVGGGAGVASITRHLIGSDFTGVAGQQGDTFFLSEASSGTQATNRLELDYALIVPNGHGYGADNSATGTLITLLFPNVTNASVRVNRCTVYAGNTGMIHVGETNGAKTGTIGYIRSTLCIGSGTGAGGQVMKIADLSTGASPNDSDVFLAEDIDFNGSYNVQQGAAQAAQPSCGKGYDVFAYTGSSIIGANDVDDEDPQFVDPTRTPLSWDVLLGGPGTWASVCARLGPGGGYTLTQVQTYIREGWAPTNPAYKNSGYLGANIGAVDVSEEEEPNNEATEMLPIIGFTITANGTYRLLTPVPPQHAFVVSIRGTFDGATAAFGFLTGDGTPTDVFVPTPSLIANMTAAGAAKFEVGAALVAAVQVTGAGASTDLKVVMSKPY